LASRFSQIDSFLDGRDRAAVPEAKVTMHTAYSPIPWVLAA
jgi:hypothetical protein